MSGATKVPSNVLLIFEVPTYESAFIVNAPSMIAADVVPEVTTPNPRSVIPKLLISLPSWLMVKENATIFIASPTSKTIVASHLPTTSGSGVGVAVGVGVGVGVLVGVFVGVGVIVDVAVGVKVAVGVGVDLWSSRVKPHGRLHANNISVTKTKHSSFTNNF